MLPSKVKCESELENEGIFTLRQEPADKDSHVLIERCERRKDTEEDFDISDKAGSSDEEQAIEINLDEKQQSQTKKRQIQNKENNDWNKVKIKRDT